MTIAIRLFSVAAVAILFAAAERSADAAGYFNLPSSVAQCIGCGYGPGYHAPMVLGPIECTGWCRHDVRRWPYAPAPPYYYGWQHGRHCDGCAGEPLDVGPSVLMPASRPFAPRVQR